jgi:hypothetical protein
MPTTKKNKPTRAERALEFAEFLHQVRQDELNELLRSDDVRQAGLTYKKVEVAVRRFEKAVKRHGELRAKAA